MNTIKKKSNWFLILLYVGVSCLYLFLIYKRYYNVPVSTFDDQLQVTLAKNISQGNWLGMYDIRTLAKGITYPVFLVGVHFSHLPLWIVQAGFTYFSVVLLSMSINPLIKNRYVRLIAFASLILNPILFDTTQASLYRDSIAYGLVCCILAWILGSFTQVVLKKSWVGAFIYAVVGIVFLPAWINLREDSFWIYPMLIVALIIISIVVIVKMVSTKRFSITILIIFLPILSAIGVNNFIANQNDSHYGRKVVNDYMSKDFEKAYGSLTRVKTDEWVINVPVNSQMRKKLYRTVPAMKQLKPYLDNNGNGSQETFKNYGVKGPLIGQDYQGGWFFWALRGAIQDSGNADNAEEFHKYNNLISKQVDEAISSGSLKGGSKERASLTPVFRKEYVIATLKFIPKLDKIFLYSDIKYQIKPSILSNENYDTMRFVKVGFTTNNYDQYHGKLKMLHSIKTIFSIYTIVGFIISGFVILGFIYQLIRRKIQEIDIWKFVILLGLIAELVLRIIMLSYVSISSFESYGYNYLSTVFPLMMLTIAISLDVTIYFIGYVKKNNPKR